MNVVNLRPDVFFVGANVFSGTKKHWHKFDIVASLFISFNLRQKAFECFWARCREFRKYLSVQEHFLVLERLHKETVLEACGLECGAETDCP